MGAIQAVGAAAYAVGYVIDEPDAATTQMVNDYKAGNIRYGQLINFFSIHPVPKAPLAAKVAGAILVFVPLARGFVAEASRMLTKLYAFACAVWDNPVLLRSTVEEALEYLAALFQRAVAVGAIVRAELGNLDFGDPDVAEGLGFLIGEVFRHIFLNVAWVVQQVPFEFAQVLFQVCGLFKAAVARALPVPALPVPALPVPALPVPALLVAVGRPALQDAGVPALLVAVGRPPVRVMCP